MKSRKFSYLKEINSLYASPSNNISEIVFILGNSGCDMDSCLSSYLLSLGKNLQEKIISIPTKNSPKLDKSTHLLYLPVLNCPRGTLPYRIDIKLVFEKFDINENDFLYISDPIFSKEKLFVYNNKSIKASIVLVDHSKLIEAQEYLAPYVSEIYDHHLYLEGYNKEYGNIKKINIKYPLGSCTTLILNDYFFDKDDFPCLVDPLLAVTSILIDTENFLEKFYLNRWYNLDKIVYEKIISKRPFKNKDVDKYFHEVFNSKYDVEKNLNLGIEVLFTKDFKIFKWNKITALWSSLQVGYDKIQRRFGNKEIINYYNKFYSELKNEEEKKNLLVISVSKYDENVNMLTIYCGVNNGIGNLEEVKDFISKKIGNEFIEIKEEKEDDGAIFYLKTTKIGSRKYMEPVLREIYTK